LWRALDDYLMIILTVDELMMMLPFVRLQEGAMPKLDVGVGDEFPAKEVREDRDEDEPVVHHHHYYRRYYRRPGRWLYFVLWIMVITFVFRLLDFAFLPFGAAWNWAWGGWGGWGPGHAYGGWQAMKGMLMGILIIAGLIWIGRWRRMEDERDAEERDRRDGR
jgi:hypothetical protein